MTVLGNNKVSIGKVDGNMAIATGIFIQRIINLGISIRYVTMSRMLTFLTASKTKEREKTNMNQ